MQKISVILPAYSVNTNRFLNSTINSIQKQDYQNLELIIVVDGGDVSQVESLTKYLNEKTKLFKIRDVVGTAKAINLGFSKSTGEYITIHDHDDISSPNRMSKLIDQLGQNDIIASSIRLKYQYKERIKRFEHDFALNSFKKNKLRPPMYLNSVLMKRSVFECMGGLETKYRYGYDSIFCIKLWLIMYFVQNKTIARIDEPLYTWVRHSTSITAKNKKEFSSCNKKYRNEVLQVKDEIMNCNSLSKMKKLLGIHDNISDCAKIEVEYSNV